MCLDASQYSIGGQRVPRRVINGRALHPSRQKAGQGPAEERLRSRWNRRLGSSTKLVEERPILGVANEDAPAARVGTCLFNTGASAQLKLDATRERGLASKPGHGETQPVCCPRVTD